MHGLVCRAPDRRARFAWCRSAPALSRSADSLRADALVKLVVLIGDSAAMNMPAESLRNHQSPRASRPLTYREVQVNSPITGARGRYPGSFGVPARPR
jgi:hypothetical protein